MTTAPDHDYMLQLVRKVRAEQRPIEAIKRRRTLNQEGPKREAFEAYRLWLTREMEPAFTRLCDKKLRDVARAHGVTEGEILHAMQNPPAGEARRALLNYVYELVMG
jgi:hypothetical protein